MRSLTTLFLTVLCVLLPSAGVAIAASPAPLAPPTLPRPTADHRASATLGERASFRFAPLGARFAAADAGRAKTGSATLSGFVLNSYGGVAGAQMDWYVPTETGWDTGSTTTDGSGAYSLAGVSPAAGNGELWCAFPTGTLLLGRTGASWPDAITTSVDFWPQDFGARLVWGGPWGDGDSATVWLYGRDGLSDLVSATSLGKYSGNPYALPGLYDKAAVYWWTNEGKELDVRLRAVDHPGYLAAVEFVDGQTGWMLDSTRDYTAPLSHVLRTTDGGLTWSTTRVPGEMLLEDLAFLDVLHGWAVGCSVRLEDYSYIAEGAILATSDGGETWAPQSSPVTQQLLAVDFVDADHGWAVGQSGAIVATDDGGATWTAQTSGTSADLSAVDFCDTSHGWAVGSTDPGAGEGTILATTDGGATWTPQTSGTFWGLGAVFCADATHGCIVGGNGVGLFTTDGGATWSETYVGTTGEALDFVDASTGWAAGADGAVSKTVDGGATWSSQRPGSASEYLSAVACADAGHVWAVGGANVTDTEDGGAVWSTRDFTADEASAQRFTASSKLGASGNPGSSVKLTFTNFPKGYVSLLSGYPEYPENAAARSLGSYTSRGGTKETKSVTLPKTAKPGYTYWFGTENKNGVLYLEAPFQVSRLKASRTVVSPGGSVKLTGVVPTQGHWGSTAGKTKRCALFKSTRSATAGYKFVKYVRANGYGVFNAGYQKPARTTWYLVYYPGDKWYWADVTTPVKITVK